MNSIHDMGGMHGFGPVPIERDEPVFHEDWQAKAMALRVSMAAWKKWNIDAGRHSIECFAPAQYLGLSYYERWITSLADLSVNAGLISLEEIEQGQVHPDAGTAKQTPPMSADSMAALIQKGRPAARQIDVPALFAVGDQVRTSHNSPEGHTRLPRYARGKQGEIIRHHGAHVFPDSNAQFLGEAPQHLYTVKFSAAELWGVQGNSRDSVTLDLWQSYLTCV